MLHVLHPARGFPTNEGQLIDVENGWLVARDDNERLFETVDVLVLARVLEYYNITLLQNFNNCARLEYRYVPT